MRVRERWNDLSPLARNTVWATLCVAIAASAFAIKQPAVRDSWAALARAQAVHDGVGLGYWFSWYAGASPPGSYSVLVPFLSNIVSAYVVIAVAASIVPAATAFAVRTTRHPIAGVWVAAVSVILNTWSGRVTFVVGAMIATWGMGFALHKRPRKGALLIFLSGLASPVAVAFSLVGLGAGFLVRRVSWIPIIAGIAFMGLSVVLWGSSGPQGFGWASASLALFFCALYFLADPPKAVKYALVATALAVVVVASVPNALGMNLARLVFAVLPVVVASTARARKTFTAIAVIPPLVWLGYFTVNDVRDASANTSSMIVYDALTHALESQPDIDSTRVEVVADGTQTAAYVLADKFWLARGWETQADRKLSNGFVDIEAPMSKQFLDTWTKRNSIGYVAVSKRPIKRTGEWNAVMRDRPTAWKEVWSNDDWLLYRVPSVDPIVSPPNKMVSKSQSEVVIDAPKAGRILVRVAWSRYLDAKSTDPTVETTIEKTPEGWTEITVNKPAQLTLGAAL